eukprot:m.53555 g.53555  ORF g.53555 m.53555 type:complete len:104 (+) comp34256_c0_seq30:944-1255(+)
MSFAMNMQGSIRGTQTVRGCVRERPQLSRQQSEYVAMSSIMLPTNDPVDLEVFDWYHGVMSRQQAEYVLTMYGVQCSFIVRESDHFAGRYAVSIRLFEKKPFL